LVKRSAGQRTIESVAHSAQEEERVDLRKSQKIMGKIGKKHYAFPGALGGSINYSCNFTLSGEFLSDGPEAKNIPPPTTERQLNAHPFKHYYVAAGKAEKEALKKRGTLLRLVHLDEVKRLGKRAAKSRMLYAWKEDIFYKGGDRGPPGERAKGRWIICGYSMVPGLDFGKTASPSADMNTWRVMVAISIMIRAEELEDHQFDVPTAYLWSVDRLHRMFMHQAPGHEEPNSEGMVWELGTYLYGEPPAGLAWYMEAVSSLKEIGYEKNPACPALFSKITKKRTPFNQEWYDSDVNKHRRVWVRDAQGAVGIVGRDMYVTYILLQVARRRKGNRELQGGRR
jgi:hypothetical protein